MRNFRFLNFSVSCREGCLRLFDLNCPEFFCPDERQDYVDYLSSNPVGYQVVVLDNEVVGAFGFSVEKFGVGEIHWILVDPNVRGSGLGRKMMESVFESARPARVSQIRIAASHLSAPFFARFGAEVVNTIEDGWGEGMHRLDMVLLVG